MFLLAGLPPHLAHSDALLVLSCILKARHNDCIRINVTVFKKARTRAVWLRLSGGGLVYHLAIGCSCGLQTWPTLLQSLCNLD